MNRRNLKDMTLQELIDLFAQNGIEQDRVIRRGEAPKFTDIFYAMGAIDAELTRRGPHAKMSLSELYDHPNMQVRLQAAKVARDVDPVNARQVLETIAKSVRMPQAADARGTLRILNSRSVSPN
jgi:hypothetical protein